MGLKSKLSSKVVSLIILGAFAYCSLLMGRVWKQRKDLDHKVSFLQSELSVLQQKKQQFLKKKHYLESEEFAEKEARSLLNYQKAGEEVVVVIPEKPSIQLKNLSLNDEKTSLSPVASSTHSNFYYWWQYLFGKRQ